MATGELNEPLSRVQRIIDNQIRQSIEHEVLFYYLGHFRTIRLRYFVCPCREKYKLNNPLLSHYLKTKCQGWLEDPDDRYTLNYLILVLLTNLQEKGHLRFFDTLGDYFIADLELISILGFDSFTVFNLRSQIRDLFHLRKTKGWHPPALFLCVSDEDLISSLPRNPRDPKYAFKRGH